MLQLQLLLVAQGRWHHHPLIRNRRLSQKSDSCWQPTVLSIRCLFVHLFRLFVCIARTILHSSSAYRAISCAHARYRTCLFGISTEQARAICCMCTRYCTIIISCARTFGIADQPKKHVRYLAGYLSRAHAQYARACYVWQINRTSTCDILHAHEILHDIYHARNVFG